MRQTSLSIAFATLAVVLLGAVSVDHLEARTLYRSGQEVERQDPADNPDPPVTTPNPYIPPPTDYSTTDDWSDADFETTEKAYIIETRSDVDDLYDAYTEMKAQVNRTQNASDSTSLDEEDVPEERHEAAPNGGGFGVNMFTWAIAGIALIFGGGIYVYTMITGKRKKETVPVKPSPENQPPQTLQAQPNQGQPAVIVQVQPQPAAPQQQPSDAQE